MDTRKLRLLHLAYLRGNGNLIRADYPQGVRSVLRENMIISALAMEKAAEHGKLLQATLSTVYAPHYDPKKLKEVSGRLTHELNRLHQMGMLDLVTARRKMAQGSVDALVKIYQALDKSKFFDMIREEHFRINPSERRRARS